ncbi:hypothetical protein [Reichenbachiella versicolor]|uniref:hypothetical protein n=1 Tax=Reichenbachiella versicolor TaxID=1821036 RepID=UPI0013A54823|nr:hypothetical protein [Reichenbachiella versicolor]
MTYIQKFADDNGVELKRSGVEKVGQQFLSIIDDEKGVNFSFTSVDSHEDGVIYLCVYNNLPHTSHEYQVILTEQDDYLVHVHHQYDHYNKDKKFVGNLPYHLYQIAKVKLNNEKVITAHSALDALLRY